MIRNIERGRKRSEDIGRGRDDPARHGRLDVCLLDEVLKGVQLEHVDDLQRLPLLRRYALKFYEVIFMKLPHAVDRAMKIMRNAMQRSTFRPLLALPGLRSEIYQSRFERFWSPLKVQRLIFIMNQSLLLGRLGIKGKQAK